MASVNFDNMMNKINELKSKAPKANYRCSICKDTGWVFVKQVNSQPIAKHCICQKKTRLQTQWKESGFNVDCEEHTLNKFEADRNKVSARMKEIAESYIKDYEGIQFEKNNSIAFLGEPGTGKTHICVAICLELLKKGFRPVYFPYRDCMDKLIDLRVSDKSKYNYELSKYQKCNILFLDDVFKGGYTEAEIRLFFKIINYRYINKLSIIVSSEYTSQRLLSIDKGIGSRIIEMAKNRTLDISGEQYNQRLYWK